MDIPPRETFDEFVKRWYGYASCSHSEYARKVFHNLTKGSIFVTSYGARHCTIFGTEETAGKNFIKYSATFVNNLGEI